VGNAQLVDEQNIKPVANNLRRVPEDLLLVLVFSETATQAPNA
jgi:hypothetical protein